MSVGPAPEEAKRTPETPAFLSEIPLTRWILVGYLFWVGIYLGALIMRTFTMY